MKKKDYITLWAAVQLFLFVMPLALVFVYTPYEISREMHYSKTINKRALIDGYKQEQTFTDFTEATIAENDAVEVYEQRAWQIKHPEKYWIDNFVCALFVILFLQLIGNLIFWAIYSDNYWGD